MGGDDDKAAQAERARRLREQIHGEGRGSKPPRNPREFVEEKMREERDQQRPPIEPDSSDETELPD